MDGRITTVSTVGIIVVINHAAIDNTLEKDIS